MFRKKEKNYREIFEEAFERLSDAEKNQVIELARQATELANKHPTQPDPKRWGDIEDTMLVTEISNRIKTIVFR